MAEKNVIHEIYVYVTDDKDGEGVTGFLSGDTWIAMIGADVERAQSLEPIAQQIARQSGQPVRLLKFSVREELKVIEP